MRHALGFTQFVKQVGIFLFVGVVLRVDDTGLVDVLQTELGGHLFDLLGRADEDDIGDAVSQKAIGGFQGTGFVTLGEHNALLVGLRVGNDFLH